MKKIIISAAIFATLFANNAFAQSKKDKAVFIEYKNEFMDTIKQDINKFKAKPEKNKLTFKMDFSNLDLPTKNSDFKQVKHFPPLSQGTTSTCWSYAGNSFFESEIYRLHKRDVKLSEMYTVYWEYIEKAKRFIQERGASAFAEGGQSQGPPEIMKKYGAMPSSVYSGLKPNQKFPDHEALFDELNNYMQSLKKNSSWNEELAISTIKSILNHYLGEPPQEFAYNGKNYNPKTFCSEIVDLNFDDYIDFMSLMEKPYYTLAEYQVEDNWRRDSTSYNVPLDVFMQIVKKSIRNGYSLCIGGDVSEAGMESHAGVAMVPSFDIPSEYIDENARQFRFSNGSTTDDHGIHLVGYMEKDGKDWYLIKDSGSGAKNNGKHWGYYYFSEDYIKLKMMNAMVHKSAVEDILKKFVK